MTRKEKLLNKARNNPQGLKFEEICSLAEHWGWVLDRIKGSHHIYTRTDGPGFLDFQPGCNGTAKPYQVRQLLNAIEELEDNEDDHGR